MNSKKSLSTTNKFIIKLVAMMKVLFILSSNFHPSSTGVMTAKNFRFITFNFSPPKSIQNTSIPVTINPSYDKYSPLTQLNMYNFSKMSKRKNSINFRHPAFCKGQ